MTDIIHSAALKPYVVTGFFTPDYRHLAQAFAANLLEHNIPHHLFAVERDTWGRSVMKKPAIVMRAMGVYPTKTIVLSDVDCIIKGPIDAALSDADITYHLRVKNGHKRQKIWSSSRFIAFKPNPATRRLVGVWAELCARHLEGKNRLKLNEEHLLTAAVSACGPVTIGILGAPYAAFEVGEAGDDAVIVHKSAHDETRPAWTFQKWLRAKRRAAVSRLIGRPYEEWKYGVPS